MSSRLTTTLAVAALLGASALHAQNTVDQSQTIDVTGYASLYNHTAIGIPYQTFTPSANNVSGGGFFLDPHYRTSGPATIFIQLLNAAGTGGYIQMLPHPAAGAVLAQGSTTINSFGWVDVFWAAVGVTPGGSYALALFSDETAQGYTVGYGGYNDLYPGGQAYFDYGTDAPGRIDTQGNTDLTFREYSDLSYSVTPTPEPASMTLMAAGLAGILGVARRRRGRSAEGVS